MENNAKMREAAALPVAGNRAHGLAGAVNVQRYWMVRLGFGLIWGIDATLKWLPGFRDNYLMMIQASAQGQPAWLLPFFHVWARAVAPAPGLFATLTAVAETAICLSLLLGIAQRAGFIVGAALGLLIWAVGEGFGGRTRAERPTSAARSCTRCCSPRCCWRCPAPPVPPRPPLTPPWSPAGQRWPR
jgi:hypothetical protein